MTIPAPGASSALAEEAAAAALAALPAMGPARLRALLERAGTPQAAWLEVLAGRGGGEGSAGAALAARWAAVAATTDPAQRWGRARDAGLAVTWLDHPAYPARLTEDPQPPPVLFSLGRLDALAGPCVAIIGTRAATLEGRSIAAELAADLAAAGVAVVSGLALGIDGAAHRGALATGRAGATLGVAASGVDVPYPSSHRELWAQVAASGAVVSEAPPGCRAQRWRFPLRNRVIAGLADAVVVVESHAAGGSMLTVDAALERGVPVLAVPGPVRSPASAGTNQLLADGAAPARHAADVLDAIGVVRPGGDRRAAGAPHRGGRQRPGRPGEAHRPPAAAGARGAQPTAVTAAVLAAVGWRPTSLNAVVEAAALPLGTVAVALEELAAAGAVVGRRGWWQRRS